MEFAEARLSARKRQRSGVGFGSARAATAVGGVRIAA